MKRNQEEGGCKIVKWELEIRNSKLEIRNKSEISNPKTRDWEWTKKVQSCSLIMLMKELRLAPAMIGLFSVLLVTFPSRAAEWKLVWSDEFDKPGLPDATRWNYETGFIRNNEAQYYTRERKENSR